MRLSGKALAGIAITIACLYLAFHDLDWTRALETLRHANYALLLLGAFLATCMFPLRAIRWRVILDPVAPKLPLGSLWRSIAIGMMVNNVALLRAGELARAFALTREEKTVSFPTSLASLVVDRVFDAIVVLLLLAVAIVISGFSVAEKITTPMGAFSLAHVAMLFAVAPIVMLVALYSLVFYPAALIGLFELAVRRVSPALEQKGGDMLRRFAAGLSVLKSPFHFVAVFWWTLLHWLLQPLAFWVGLRALGIWVPWFAPLFMQGVIVILVALPSAPGFFGLFELGAKISLGFYGIAESDAATWGFIFHVVSFIPITLIGAYYATRLGFRLGDVSTADATAT